MNTHLSRSVVSAVLIVVLTLTMAPFAGAQEGPDYWPTESWLTSTPEAQGMDSGAIADYLLTLNGPGLYVDSVMIVRHGQIVAEAYYCPINSRHAVQPVFRHQERDLGPGGHRGRTGLYQEH